MNIQLLEEMLRSQSEIDGALIESFDNRRYLTGFPSSAGSLLVTGNGSVFLTDCRYIEAAQNTIKDCEVRLNDGGRKTQAEIFKAFGAKKIAIEGEKTSVCALSRIEKGYGEVGAFAFLTDSTLDKMLTLLRTVKAQNEIDCIVKAQRIAEGAFTHVLSFIREGVTEREIGLELDYCMLRCGAEALSFETIAVSGANSSMPHGVPSDKKVERGDFITMDFGAMYGGYHSDMTRTVAVGAVSDKQAEVYNTVLKAQEAALAALRPGLLCRDADEAARRIIRDAGYGECFGHSTGHGVGVEIHEEPRLSPASPDTLEIGNVVTVEPGIYIPSEFGVRIEDMAVITKNGCENLTFAEKKLIIL